MAASETIEVVANSISGDVILGPMTFFRATAIEQLRSKLEASRQPCSGLVRVALAFGGQVLEDSSPIDIDRLECTAMFEQEDLTQKDRICCIWLLHKRGNFFNYSYHQRYDEYRSGWWDDRRWLKTEYESVATLFASFSDTARSHAEVVMEAIQMSAQSFKFAHSKFRTNREYVLKAVNKNGMALQFAASELQEDRQVVVKAVKQNGMALQFAASELQGDRQLVVKAVKQHGMALQFAACELKGNRPLVVDAVRQDVKALQFVPKALCKDRAFLEEAFVVNSLALSYIPFEIEYDWLMSMISSAIDDSSQIFESVDRSEALRKARIDGMWLAEAIELQNDKEIVLAAVEQNPKALRFTSLLDDRDVVLAAVGGDGMMLELADESLRRDHEIVCAAIRSNPRARRFAIDKPLFDVLDTDLEDEVDSSSNRRKCGRKGKRFKSFMAGLTGTNQCCERRGEKQRCKSKLEQNHGSRQCHYSRKLK